jgi:hypothetical protein
MKANSPTVKRIPPSNSIIPIIRFNTIIQIIHRPGFKHNGCELRPFGDVPQTVQLAERISIVCEIPE